MLGPEFGEGLRVGLHQEALPPQLQLEQQAVAKLLSIEGAALNKEAAPLPLEEGGHSGQLAVLAEEQPARPPVLDPGSRLSYSH